MPLGDITPHDVLIRPLITEKALSGVKNATYSFEVDLRANKHTVRNAVERLYNVQVADVRIMNVKGKPKRYGRSEGYSRSYKKAIVQLKEGFKIQELEGLI
ncbi:MAG: 50S ribosomal protein L23 [Athalassotoga sp.]|uniref:50S ribosomal protein L23 n=1 Tax=Athalassotoga TaxID=1769718 RepID=UPI00137B4DE9|nr:50S ribosomal protein L23 [Athalassotoga saccharophila]